MSRKPLVDVNQVMARTAQWDAENLYAGLFVCVGDMRAILEDVVTKYEAALDGANADTEPTPGFFNAENMHCLHKMAHNHERRISELETVKTPAADRDELDMLHRRIDKLADRVAMLERVRWAEEGEL